MQAAGNDLVGMGRGPIRLIRGEPLAGYGFKGVGFRRLRRLHGLALFAGVDALGQSFSTSKIGRWV